MKHITLFSVLALALTLVSCGSSARISSEEKKANEQRLALAIQQKLNSKDYTIDVNYMIPIRAAARVLTSPYSLTVKNDTLKSHLPYFGEAHNIPYGGDSGLVFEGKIKDYKDNGIKKDRHSIVIDIAIDGDVLCYTLTVYDNGQADINVTSRNRDNISFRGALKL